MRFRAKSGESRSEPLPAGAENFPYWEVRAQVSPPLLRGDPVANKRSCANFPPSNRSCGMPKKKMQGATQKKHPRTKPDTILGHPDGPRPQKPVPLIAAVSSRGFWEFVKKMHFSNHRKWGSDRRVRNSMLLVHALVVRRGGVVVREGGGPGWVFSLRFFKNRAQKVENREPFSVQKSGVTT